MSNANRPVPPIETAIITGNTEMEAWSGGINNLASDFSTIGTLTPRD